MQNDLNTAGKEFCPGLVVIGRNEGHRLQNCLESLAGQGSPLVYVDSGSTDSSTTLARSLGADVVELDMQKPFSMSRARNAGFARVLELEPDTVWVHFFDGDCTVVQGWVPEAVEFIRNRPDAAAVSGRRREVDPGGSIYNAMADMEWDAPPGPAESVGGDALYRVQAFSQVGGFNQELIAGEEPELCFRLRARGWKIYRAQGEMTLHDAQIYRFRQWWRRMVRGGYGSLDVYQRCRPAADSSGDIPFRSMVRSARIWSLGWGLASLLLMLVMFILMGWAGAVLGLALAAGAWLLQAGRIFVKSRASLEKKSAMAFAVLTMLGKWAQAVGHVRCYLDRARGRKAGLIEYKNVVSRPSDWKADRARYPSRAFLREQSLWAIAVYRLGRWNDKRRPGVTRWFVDRLYWFMFRVVETLTSVSFTKETRIGPGLRIYHFGNIFVHNKVNIGANCTLRQGVTIGNRTEGGPVPVLEDHVEIGAYAQILGGIRIGQGARIGAMSVVLQDVPPGCTAVGIPARIIHPPELPAGSTKPYSAGEDQVPQA
ncbi:glycosyltransferase family 2 protein [Desulfonatronospira sp.]|uniref:glycosyltransferase family 2 protein n=1 Tax=Desulfonatronospira sp. TaxID=1962951 RepID=UPI0025BC2765|nr:glycosyltransferase family 2 protein [Desulfonatronospira sp.]